MTAITRKRAMKEVRRANDKEHRSASGKPELKLPKVHAGGKVKCETVSDLCGKEAKSP